MAAHAVDQPVGDTPGAARARRRECGVCWAAYDPAEGDPVAQIPPGTPFDSLPEHWCCPNCEAPKFKFLVAGDD